MLPHRKQATVTLHQLACYEPSFSLRLLQKGNIRADFRGNLTPFLKRKLCGVKAGDQQGQGGGSCLCTPGAGTRPKRDYVFRLRAQPQPQASPGPTCPENMPERAGTAEGAPESLDPPSTALSGPHTPQTHLAPFEAPPCTYFDPLLTSEAPERHPQGEWGPSFTARTTVLTLHSVRMAELCF